MFLLFLLLSVLIDLIVRSFDVLARERFADFAGCYCFGTKKERKTFTFLYFLFNIQFVVVVNAKYTFVCIRFIVSFFFFDSTDRVDHQKATL